MPEIILLPTRHFSEASTPDSQNFDTGTGVPAKPRWGKHVKKQVDELVKEGIRRHIDSFPGIESHNCRNDINRQYFEQQLNIRKMCNLYVEAVKTGEINGLSSKKHLYYHIFNNEYNFSFLKPKRDQCVKCASSLLSQKLVLVF